MNKTLLGQSKIENRKSAVPLAGVVDYGMGNLRSVAKALEAAGVRVAVSDDPAILSWADILVVPGVGSFDAAMRALRRQRLDIFIKNWVKRGRPYLGICLGMQILFAASDEAPRVAGLGLLKGRVKRFRLPRKYKVPHMGWNQAKPVGGRGDLRAVLPKAGSFYFVHSFYPAPANPALVWAKTGYGKTFCSAVARGKLLATQFHPEKSGEAGLKFLRRMLHYLLRGASPHAHHTSH